LFRIASILLLFSSILYSYSQNASYQVNGNASSTNITDRNGTVSCKCFELTPNYFITPSGGVGSVWNKNKIDLNNSFVLEFDVYLGSSDGGADGIAFGLQQSSSSVGVAGNGMGLGTINPSLGVYLDTYQNSDLNDPAGDHISIQKNGDVTHNSSNELAGPMTVSNLEDNSFKRFKIEWNSTTQVFNVYLVNMITPILSHTGDIINNIFSGDPLVYWGFTGATGGSFNQQKFCTNTDLESPEFSSCPTDITISLDGNNCSSIYTFTTPTAIDNCGSTNTVQTSGLPSGSLFPIGVTTNTWVSTDLAGNTATCSFDVTVSGIDSDGDNITDLCDIDDDNDGILDSEECTIVDITPISGTTTDSQVSGLANSYNGSSAGTPFSKNNFTETPISDIKYFFANQPNIVSSFLIYNNAGGDLTDGQSIGNIGTINVYSQSGSILLTVLNVDIPEGVAGNPFVLNLGSDLIDVGRIDLFSINPQPGGLSGIAWREVSLRGCYRDSDNDGIQDKNDLDSDNDGIYDITEGGDGAADINNDGRIDINDSGFIDSDNNGMDDNAELTSELDSDNDNTKDFLDLDSDNDGCYDVIEAGYTDSNLDGILGPATTTFDADGKVTSGIDGYTPPLDTDANSIYDFTEVGPSQVSNETTTACVSYFWNGVTYSNSGTYTFSSTNIKGCDSIATLNLTIISPVTGDTNALVCDSLLWYGTWYNSTGAYTHILTAANGCDSIVTLNLDVNDYIDPSITCPNNQTDFYNSSCGFSLLDYTSLAIVADNCNYPLSITQLPSPGSNVSNNTAITLTVTDNYNNSSSCPFSLTLSDSISPSIICPSDTVQYYTNNCGYTIPNYTSLLTVTDNCDLTPTITQSPPTGALVSSDTVITLTATDDSGNSSNCSYNLTLLDTIKPIINCFGDTSEYYDNNCLFTLGDYTNRVVINDNCDANPTVTQSPAIGSIISTDTTITLFVTDASNNISSCNFNLILLDSINPTIACFGDTSDYYDNNCLFSVIDYKSRVVVFDNCDTSFTISQSPTVGSIVNADTVITLTVTDLSGNSSSCSFNLNLLDTINPVISCLGDTLDYFNGNCLFVLGDYSNRVLINDNCDNNPTIVQAPSPGVFLISDTIITLTVTDLSNNSSSCSFTLNLFDSIQPVLTCPLDVTDYYDSNCEFIIPDYIPSTTSSDNCDGNPILTQSPVSGTVIYNDTVITITSSDNSGNFNMCSFNLTILDSINPTVNCIPSQTLYLDTACNYLLPNYIDSISTSDNCDTNLVITQFPVAGSIINSDTIVIISIFDSSGNNTTCEIPIFLLDTINPVISCPNNTVIDNDPLQCGAIFSYSTPLGIDNCLSTTTLTSGLPDSSFFPVGVTTNVYRVTDTAGNFSTCSFYVLVNDVELPTITCPSDTIEPYDQNCEFIVPDYANLLIFADNCGIEIIDQIPAVGTIVDYDFNTFFTITDSSGNSNACSYNVSLYDLDVPEIICPSDQDLMLDENCVVLIPDFSNDLQVGALCSSSKTIYQSPSADTLIDFIGVQNITFNVFDTLGNVETCSFNLNIINNDINNCYQLFIPTVFSPDGDGINDIFQAYGLDKVGLEIEIYNRWGQMVHKTDLNSLNWDGTFMGEKLPNETYVYRVFFQDGSLKIDGTISIVR